MGNCYNDRMDSIPDLVHYRSRTVVIISTDEDMGLSKKLDQLNTHYKFKSQIREQSSSLLGILRNKDGRTKSRDSSVVPKSVSFL